MINVTSRGIKYTVKSSFNDFSFSDFALWATVVWNVMDEIFDQTTEGFDVKVTVKDPERFALSRQIMLFKLTSLNQRQLDKLPDSVVYELLEDYKVMDFVFSPPPLFTLPYLNAKKLVGPKDQFNVLNVSEFVFLHGFYTSYKESKNTSDVDWFNACILRQKRKVIPLHDPTYLGDKRVPFAKNDVESRLKAVSHIKSGYKLLPMVWFEAHLNTFKSKFPHLTTGGESEDQGKASWLKNILAMSNTKFGDFNSTEQTPILYFMAEMDRLKEEYINAKRNAARRVQ